MTARSRVIATAATALGATACALVSVNCTLRGDMGAAFLTAVDAALCAGLCARLWED